MTKTTALVRPHAKGHPGLFFQEAKREISEAKTVEQVNDIRKKAMALAAYALQANNRQLKEEAEAIRMMAERRIGQMMQEQKKTVGLNAGTAGRGRPKKGGLSKNPPKKDAHPTLAEAGIDKNLAHKARKAAAKSEDEFAKEVEAKRAEAREPPSKEKRAPKKEPEPIPSLVDQCITEVQKKIQRTIAEMLRRHAPQVRFSHLFAALHDALTDLERRTLPEAEEDAAAEADLARPRINREKAKDAAVSAERRPPVPTTNRPSPDTL
jgi:hypothetical protein